MVTVYTLAYNEELLIQFMIDHYRTRFPYCAIVVYDNMSTDNTAKIALINDCEVIPYDTNNQLMDRRFLEIKNNCWKSAKTNWVVVCDMDELLDIDEGQLKAEASRGSTIIQSDVYDMIGMTDDSKLADIKYGVESPLPGKICLFNKKYIREINYEIGAHACHPVGRITFSKKKYPLYHYNSINPKQTIKKFKERASRLSDENLRHGWGQHYQMTTEEIRKEYSEERPAAIKVR